MSRVRTYWPSCQVEPKCPWMIHRSRFPAMAAPMLERTLGSGIQQSRMLIPWASQQSMTALTSSALWRSSHSAPRPISLTISPVFPSARYLIKIPLQVLRVQIPLSYHTFPAGQGRSAALPSLPGACIMG
ncbi:Uncharacterised protein [Flavonifractor plautii]|uniref:Uncharacterized protein n=1 Tax=Flavonifractor plautii TaxID=292800 RepID=A0A174NHP5_FLAPL|nr:Uncharacterised protein [Flavonifractor plautii]